MGVGGDERVDLYTPDERGLVGLGVIGLGSTETVAWVVVGTECGNGGGGGGSGSDGGGSGGDEGEADACIDADGGIDVRPLFMVNSPRIFKLGLDFLLFGIYCVGDVGVDIDVKAGIPSSSCVVSGSLNRSMESSFTSVIILCGLVYAYDSLDFVCINLEGN